MSHFFLAGDSPLKVDIFVLDADIFLLYNDDISDNWSRRLCKEYMKQLEESDHLQTRIMPTNY
jgi:hypothetical protein